MALMDQASPSNTSFHNQLLAQAEAKLEAGLTPQNKVDYMKIVVAGMQIFLKGGPQGLSQKLTQSKDPMATATAGPINLIANMAHAAKGGPMPQKAMVPAAMTLMLHALDMLEGMGKIQVTADVLDQATKKFADNIFRAFNITAQKFDEMTQQAHGVTQNPQHLAAIKQRVANFKAPPPPSQAAPAPAAEPPPPGGPPSLNQ